MQSVLKFVHASMISPSVAFTFRDYDISGFFHAQQSHFLELEQH